MIEERTPEEQKQIDEWLKNNEVTICPPGERTSDDNIAYTHGWGKKKKKAAGSRASASEKRARGARRRAGQRPEWAVSEFCTVGCA